MLIIEGIQWLTIEGKVLTERIVEINQCGNIHPYNNGPVFSVTTKVFLMNCDKNFIYYWLKTKTFPTVEDIYLFSHPCAQRTAQRRVKHPPGRF